MKQLRSSSSTASLLFLCVNLPSEMAMLKMVHMVRKFSPKLEILKIERESAEGADVLLCEQ